MGEMSDKLQDRVELLTKDIVDKPESVEISVSVSTKAIMVQVRVDDRDCGKIIGRKGRTIEALKILCMAIKNTNYPDDSRRIIIEVLEDENSSFSYD
ncbi:MAG: KH domain-containing protein [Candidatus Heimdallarchaeaceae archaeon]